MTTGGTLQLKAVATYTGGAVEDVTRVALWRSSNPSAAVVGADGLLKTAQAGNVDVTAAIGAVVGSAQVQVGHNCSSSTLSSTASSYTAFAHLVQAEVTAPFSDCRWTASPSTTWLTLNGGSGTLFEPGQSGNGKFTFLTEVNNTPFPRVGTIVVTFTDGTQLTHTVSQAAPPTCSYLLQPTEHTLPPAGGSGSFAVIVTPPTCSWIATNSSNPYWQFQIVGGHSGVGDGVVSYSAQPPAGSTSVAFTIIVRGPNPEDPPARFTVRKPQS